MGKFDGILICTDLDGTLLRNDGTISQENLDAIAYFKREGGYFTFITGRMPYYAMHVCEAIRPNVPFGCINGGGVYDHIAKKYIWAQEMPKDVCQLIKSIDEAFPQVGIQVVCFEKTYFPKDNDAMEHFRAATNLPNFVCHYEHVKEPIGKIIFGSESDAEILAIQQTLLAHPRAGDFDFIRSERTLFEILPKGIGKGVAVEKLAEHLKTDKTIAIGDYNNDISMFHAAKLGVAVANACPDALAAADYVTVSNEEHAVAQIISDLENGKILI